MKLTLNNGWIFLICLYIIQFFLIFSSSKEVRSRLLDRSEFTKKQWIFTGISKIIVLIVQIIITLTPLVNDILEFTIGLTIFILGMCGVITAVNTFKNTPLDVPVTQGLYRISRNPQETSLSIAFIGICLSVGSLFLIVLFLFSRIFNHFHILAQEEACLKNYRELYQYYMNEIPRYFLFL